MKNNFFSIHSTCSVEFSHLGSKYKGFIYRGNDLKNIKYRLNILKKDNPLSTHICYAYRLYDGFTIIDFSTDAGEPRGTAGPPILNSLKSNNMVNVVIFVIRYFGGKKIGISGLIDVYSKCADLLIDKAKIIEWYHLEKIELIFDYRLEKKINAILKEVKIKIFEKKFNKKVQYIIKVDFQKLHETKNILNEITSGKILIRNL